MRKFKFKISLILTSVLIFSLVPFGAIYTAAEIEPVMTDFGPIYYLEDDETVDYQKTQCKVGLQFFISGKSAEYEEFMSKHFSSPDLSSNLLDAAVAKFNAYRDMLNDEFFKYRAESGATIASQFELLEECYTLIKNEVEDRQVNLKQNFKAGRADRKSLRLSAKYETINSRFKDLIHFPYAQFLGRMKSFADGLACYTNKCAQ